MNKWIVTLMMLLPTLALAEDTLDTGDTMWMMASTALVLIMTPAGLALFYAGMTRTKDVLNTYAMVMGAFIVASVLWVVAGYSLAFSTNGSSFLQNVFGGFDNVLLSGIKWNDLSGSYPAYVFVAFQGMFAAITVAIAAGSAIERMKYTSWILFVALWGLIVYAPVAHMVWGGDGAVLFDAGALDFAGGTVVHMNGGLAGLVLAIMLGKRTGYPNIAIKPTSIVLTGFGAALLWFGWYGFNAGSAFGANTIAGLALLTTTVATAAAAITWMLLEWVLFQKPTLLGIASGIIAGLVAITPAAGFVGLGGAFVVGIVGAIIGFFGVAILKSKLGYDDSLDAFGIHFLAGMWGAIATGLFALNDQDLLWDGPLKADGDRMGQLLVQFEAIFIVGLWTLIGTIVVYLISSALTGGARINEETETMGLDEAVHGERGFNA